jgi:hypothetical protein
MSRHPRSFFENVSRKSQTKAAMNHSESDATRIMNHTQKNVQIF